MVRVVLFDIDGTLIRTGGAGVRAFGRAFSTAFGLHNGTEQIQFAGRTDSGIVREFFGLHGIEPSEEHFRRFYECYVFWLDHLLSESRGGACPGVWTFLGDLQELPKPPLFGLLTGNIRLGAEIKLRHHELWGIFRTGAFGDDHECRNELAAVAHHRASRLLGRKLRGEEILVIGDTPHDINCAKAIGAKSLAVATGGCALDELHAHHPTWAMRELREISAEEACCS
ncbi:MAG: haloacid dehalogenase-like hydrolase [Verrucomicrobia bacterium]|nr:haloacid dehalogenase-like hydrolase [Verrucomicrobiota bacterium]